MNDAAEHASRLRPDQPQAWLVVDAGGHRSVLLERAAADAYAVRCHGVVLPLYVPQSKGSPT